MTTQVMERARKHLRWVLLGSELMSLKDAAKFLRVKRNYVRQLIKDGELTGYRSGGGSLNKVVIKRSEVEARRRRVRAWRRRGRRRHKA